MSLARIRLLLRLEHLGEGYDAEGRHKIEYNKLDVGSDFAFYDVTDDCLVQMNDLSTIGGAIGKAVGHPQYTGWYDLDSNGLVEIADQSAGNMFGKPCPRFIYDADGNLMKLEGRKWMVYIGGIYEKNLDTSEITKYYHTADGRRLAMRKVPSGGGGGTLNYFANDHLGGTAVVMDASGGLVSRTRYYPYGQGWTQEVTAVPPTDRLFTRHRRYGQKSGIYHYGARFYSADIGRFLSPDSIVPGAGDPQALDRYAYVRRAVTATGHSSSEASLPDWAQLSLETSSKTMTVASGVV